MNNLIFTLGAAYGSIITLAVEIAALLIVLVIIRMTERRRKCRKKN